MYMPGFIALCVGGPSVFFATLRLADLWPARPSLVTSVLSSAFDTSTAIFLLYELLNSATGLSSSNFFLAYLSVPAVFLLLALFGWPRRRSATTDTSGVVSLGREEELSSLRSCQSVRLTAVLLSHLFTHIEI
jgi:hypothetical protein